jgi:hypothetical protein
MLGLAKETSKEEEAPMGQYVGIDLHRRSTTIVRMAEDGQVLGTKRFVSQPFELAQAMAAAGTEPEVVLESDTKASGNRVSLASPPAAFAVRAATLSSVASRSKTTEPACTTAALNGVTDGHHARLSTCCPRTGSRSWQTRAARYAGHMALITGAIGDTLSRRGSASEGGQRAA